MTIFFLLGLPTLANKKSGHSVKTEPETLRNKVLVEVCPQYSMRHAYTKQLFIVLLKLKLILSGNTVVKNSGKPFFFLASFLPFASFPHSAWNIPTLNRSSVPATESPSAQILMPHIWVTSYSLIKGPLNHLLSILPLSHPFFYPDWFSSWCLSWSHITSCICLLSDSIYSGKRPLRTGASSVLFVFLLFYSQTPVCRTAPTQQICVKWMDLCVHTCVSGYRFCSIEQWSILEPLPNWCNYCSFRSFCCCFGFGLVFNIG